MILNIKKNCDSLNVNKSKYKHKSLLINREYRMNQYKKKNKNLKQVQKVYKYKIQYENKFCAFTLSNKDSSNKKGSKTTLILI